MLPHVIISLWFHLSVPANDREKESEAINGTEYFSQEPHYIHDEMIDATPGHCPDNIHYSEGDVYIIPNTKELIGEQDKKENVAARSKIKLFSPTEEALQAWKHHDIALWSPLQDIMQALIPSNQYLSLLAQLVPYTQTHLQFCTGLQELILQNLQHKEIFHLLRLTIL
jgi:hypothetical protein